VSTSLRLDRLLANMGYGSRRDVQQMVRYGEVTLDGAPVTDSDMKVVVEPGLSARMMVHGAKLDPPPGMALMLHKPVGVTCSHKEGGALVYDLLPRRWRTREPAISPPPRGQALPGHPGQAIGRRRGGALRHR
jgi:16S rRNA pseudouridine516 synthase